MVRCHEFLRGSERLVRWRVAGLAIVAALCAAVFSAASAQAQGVDDACPLPNDDKNFIWNDNPVIYGTEKSDHICGGPGPNIIIGGLLDDEIYAGGGADIIIGGHGVDILDGGSGSDWLRGGDNEDRYIGGAGGLGTDTASFADMTPAGNETGVTIDLSEGEAEIGGFKDELDQIDDVVGSAFDDVITASGGGATTLRGGPGDDTLQGTNGNDSLVGEHGADTCTNNGAPAACDDGQGAHRPAGAFVQVESRANDTELVVMGAEGAGADYLSVTRTNPSDVRVTALFGLGTVTAGPGCSQAGAAVVNCAFAATPAGAASSVMVWGDGGHDALMLGSSFINEIGTIDVNGGVGNDTLTGGSGEDVLFSGEGGHDTLTGNGGHDALISEGDGVGAAGWDQLNAGAGNDQLVTDNACAGHTLNGGDGTDIIGFARQSGVGGVLAGVNAQLGGQAKALDDATGQDIPGCALSQITNGEILEGTIRKDVLTGNAGPDTLWGRDGDDVLSGDAGQDNIYGHPGNDTLWGNAGSDELYGGDGVDKLRAKDNDTDIRINCGAGNDPPAQRDTNLDPAALECEDPIATNTYLTLDEVENGAPGRASVSGNVLTNGGAPVSGDVNVNFQKLVNGNWETQSTAVRTLVNGHYDVDDWGVGVGQWRVRAVFPEQGGYAYSESSYHSFDVQPVATETYLTVDQVVNGTPGRASVSGNVLRTNGAPASGDVNVNFQKLVNGSWQTQSTAVRTLVNGHYDVDDWGVGVGQWRVRAVFPTQGDYSGSESNYHTFDVQPVATQAYLTLGQTLHGQPGYASVSGNVLRTNGSPASGDVNVNFQKFVNGSWQTQSTAVRTLSSGQYSVDNWGVGVGQWRVRAVFNAQGDYAYSESSYHSFEIKSGYRFIARHSNRCMSLSGNNGANGTAILQWDCSSNPVPWDGQVFTRVPLGNGEFQLKINSTGKCVDVTGVSYANGAYLQQWDCLGIGQANQIWRVIPIAGQPPFVAFQAKHSGRCADVAGAGTGNGVRLTQWDCHWGGNQQWTMQAIN